MANASFAGHLDVVKWLNECQIVDCNEEILGNAAIQGHLDVMQYLHTVEGGEVTEEVIVSAIQSKDIAILKWSLRHFTGERISEYVMRRAVMCRNLEILMELRDDGRCVVGLDTYYDAISTRSYTIFRWLLSQRFLEVQDVMNRLHNRSFIDDRLRECVDEVRRLL